MLSTIKKLFPEKLKKNIRKKVFEIVKPPALPLNHGSYSQAGEDRVINYLFITMGISTPSYLDIGANHPIEGNNTYFFYTKGGKGVCIEADPSLFEELALIRANDKCLNLGVTFDDRKEADFYVFPVPALNTLSKEEAEYREKNGTYKVEKVIKIPLKNINDIIAENFDKTPDLISLDVEGIDLQILQSLDFEKYKPLVLCVETITYSENRTGQKINEILDFVVSKGYFIYADTHVNTIFVNEEMFKNSSTVVKLW